MQCSAVLHYRPINCTAAEQSQSYCTVSCSSQSTEQTWHFLINNSQADLWKALKCLRKHFSWQIHWRALVLWYTLFPFFFFEESFVFPTVHLVFLHTSILYLIKYPKHLLRFCCWHFLHVFWVVAKDCLAAPPPQFQTKYSELRKTLNSRHGLHGFWYQNRVIYLRHWMTSTFCLGNRWPHPGPGCERDIVAVTALIPYWAP